MRVLYANHTSQIGGAERSLLDLLGGLPAEVSPTVACPAGRLIRAVDDLGLPVMPIPEIDASLRIHPWHTTRAVAQLARAAVRLRVIARRASAQLIHANTIRAGLPAILATKLGGPPVVVHLRDCLPASSRAARLTRRVLMSGASMLIANSRYTAANFALGTAVSRMITIYNPVNRERFSRGRIARSEARERLGLRDTRPVLGVIAQIAPWKAQADALRCLAALRSGWPNACLLLVGDTVFTSRATRYDNRIYGDSLRRLASDLCLDGSLRFLGEREDIPEILAALDLLLVPSWEEPFGRSVIEAMAMAVPVVATNVGGPLEIITDGVDGILLPPRQPERWAAVVDDLVRQPARLHALGQQARRTAIARFGLDQHVQAVVRTYRKLLDATAA